MSIKLHCCYSLCSIYVLLGHTLVRDVPICCGEQHQSGIVWNQLHPGQRIHLGLSQGFQKEIAGLLPLYQWARHGNTLVH